MLYYGKKLVIFMISVGLLSLVTFYVSRLAPGDPLFFLLRRTSGKDES